MFFSDLEHDIQNQEIKRALKELDRKGERGAGQCD